MRFFPCPDAEAAAAIAAPTGAPLRARVPAPPLPQEKGVRAAEAPEIQAAVAATVPDRVISVLRYILKEGSYIDHSAFLLFALRFR